MPNLDPGFTPMQGRVLFHIERVFRSAGGNGCLAHQTFLGYARLYGMSTDVRTYTDADCQCVLTMIENAARDHGMHKFRNVPCS